MCRLRWLPVCCCCPRCWRRCRSSRVEPESPRLPPLGSLSSSAAWPPQTRQRSCGRTWTGKGGSWLGGLCVGGCLPRCNPVRGWRTGPSRPVSKRRSRSMMNTVTAAYSMFTLLLCVFVKYESLQYVGGVSCLRGRSLTKLWLADLFVGGVWTTRVFKIFYWKWELPSTPLCCLQPFTAHITFFWHFQLFYYFRLISSHFSFFSFWLFSTSIC